MHFLIFFLRVHLDIMYLEIFREVLLGTLTLYQAEVFELLKSSDDAARLFGPHQENYYKSCLLHPNHFKLGTAHLWALTKL